MKLTKRKGFNFFRSYYDVYNELSDADKVKFMDALLDRQFLGEKPSDLSGMAKFAYISQTNSIDSQVKGYEDKTGLKLPANLEENNTPTQGGIAPPTEPPAQGGASTPSLQVEEKGKVEEKGEDPLSEREFLEIWNKQRIEILRKPSHQNRIGNYNAKAAFKDLIKIYNREDFEKATKALFKQQKMPNNNEVMRTDPKHLLENFERYLTAFRERNDKIYGEREKKHRL